MTGNVVSRHDRGAAVALAAAMLPGRVIELAEIMGGAGDPILDSDYQCIFAAAVVAADEWPELAEWRSGPVPTTGDAAMLVATHKVLRRWDRGPARPVDLILDAPMSALVAVGDSIHHAGWLADQHERDRLHNRIVRAQRSLAVGARADVIAAELAGLVAT